MPSPDAPFTVSADAEIADAVRDYADAVAAQHAAAVALFHADPAHPAFDPRHVRVGIDCVSDNVGVLMDVLVKTGLVSERTLLGTLAARVRARTDRLVALARPAPPATSPAGVPLLSRICAVATEEGPGPVREILVESHAALRAADERFEIIRQILEHVDARAMASDGPVAKTRDEITEIEWRRIYVLAGGQ